MKFFKAPLILLAIIVFITLAFHYYETTQSNSKPIPTETHKKQHIQHSASEAQKNLKTAFESADYESVISIAETEANQDDYEFHRMYAYSLAALKRFDDAILAFEKALNLRKVPEIGYSLAYLYELTGRTKAALSLYDELSKLDLPPKMKREVFEGVARTSLFEPNIAKALQSNAEVIRFYPDTPEAFISIFKILKETKRSSNLASIVSRGDLYHLNNYLYNFWLAQLYFELKDYSNSETRFKKCVEIDPKNSTPFFYLYKIFKTKNNILKALSELEKFHEINPFLPHILFDAALDAKAEGQIQLAYKFLLSALSRDRILLSKSDNGIIKATERFIAQATTTEKSLFFAFKNYVNGDFNKAKNQITPILNSLTGTDLESAKNILRQCIQLEQAYIAYSQQLPKPSNSQTKSSQQSLITQAPKEPDKTDTQLASLINTAINNPNDIALQYQAGLELSKAGKPEEAKVFFLNAIKINPNVFEPHFSIAKVLAAENDIYKARDYINSALSINPNNSQTLSFSASLHLMNHDFARAKTDAQAAIRSNPNNSEAHLVLADLYHQNHDFKNAKMQIEKGLKLERNPQRIKEFEKIKRSISEQY